ncbi:gonadotropin-releasing hormone 3 [Acipenser ruthenus]|uniref:gonadotropin-releasing hormone 3 n=1 Tax=Acipenser ruthenus TaxID=7906 RepID=UPI002740CA49|nr:gonadotropin-releasing hormone 3 [Acipenser ruthenus]
MALARKSVLHLAVLALVAQICTSQHWSYGWLPGGKRSINELQASLEMMDNGDSVSCSEEPNPHYIFEKLNTYELSDTGVREFPKKKRSVFYKEK